jgi:hypothetical protein
MVPILGEAIMNKAIAVAIMAGALAGCARGGGISILRMRMARRLPMKERGARAARPAVLAATMMITWPIYTSAEPVHVYTRSWKSVVWKLASSAP